MQRSLLDQNEPLLPAESSLSDQQCRSLLASAIRPVRHNAPLQLSCRCKAQEPSLIDSWRADSESRSMAPARNYPMCENVREQRTRRIVFSLFLLRPRRPVLFFSYSTQLRQTLYAQVRRRSFHTACPTK